MEKLLISIVLIGAGIFSILGGVFNWDFFFNNRKAELWVRIFKRNGARVFYVLIGILVIVLAFSR